MFTDKDLAGFLEKFKATYDNDYRGVIVANSSDYESYRKNNQIDLIKEIVIRFNKAAIASLPVVEGLVIPVVSVRVTGTSTSPESGISRINISIGTRKGQKFDFKYINHLGAVSAGPEAFADVVYDAYKELIGRAFEESNIDRINESFEQIISQAGVGYTVSFVDSSPNEKAVQFIDDNSLVLRVSREKVLSPEVAGIYLFLHEDEYETVGNPEVIAKNVEKDRKTVADEVNAYATTPQFLAAKIKLISLLSDIAYFKTQTLIAKSTHSTLRSLRNTHNETNIRFVVKNDKAAGIAERVDGVLAMSLAPYDLKTYLPSDEDLLSGVREAE